MGMSIRGYARSCGVHHRAIQYAIETGLIIRQPDGSIDPEQADASWGVLHRARLDLSPAAGVAFPAGIDGELDRLYRDPPPTDPETDAHLARLRDTGRDKA